MNLQAAREVQASTAEERLRLKRLRQRTYVKQAYDRQKHKMTALRQQLASLEAQFAQLLMPSTSAQLPDSTAEDEPASEQLLKKYSELTRLQCALVMENEALYQHHSELVRLSQTIQNILDMNHAATAFYFHSLSVPEYELVVAKARAHIVKSMAEPQKACVNHELGWQVTRVVEDRLLTFSLKKSFKTFPAHELLKRSWAILSSPATYTQLYSPSVRAELHLLQHVDDDTLLYYTELESSGNAATVDRAVYLLRRESFGKGHLILVCSVDPARLDFDGEFGMSHIVEHSRSQARRESSNGPRWATMCAWMVFEELTSGETTFTYGGSSLQSWATEVQMIAMRWQILVVGYDSLLQHREHDVGD